MDKTRTEGNVIRELLSYSELLEAAKDMQWLAVVKCPPYVNKEAWEDSFDRLEKAISRVKEF